MSQRTFVATKEGTARRWVLIDLNGQVLGRIATQIALLLRGKTSPRYTPHVDTGDFIVAINASKIRLTGKKWEDKIYYHHTGYIGGIKEETAAELLQKAPDRLLRKAVKGMLPRNTLSHKLLNKLNIYAGAEHPHAAQKPIPLTH